MDQDNSPQILWENVNNADKHQWWSHDSSRQIVATIGAGHDNQPVNIFFGVDDNNQPCSHGMLVAMTGAGKTALFHSLIASLITRYSPDELNLILIDGKAGVSFATYRNLPHMQMISLNTRPDMARAILAEIIEEMTYRNTLFKKHAVENYTEYRQKNSPGEKLPRILIVADEYQILFDDDLDEEASRDLLRITEQARSAGIHLMLGSQHSLPAGMSYKYQILSNLHLRIHMKMTPAEITSDTDLGYKTRQLIESFCTQTGRFVINAAAGHDDSSRPGSVAYLPVQQLRSLVNDVQGLTHKTPSGVVFDGEEMPDLLDSPICKALLKTNFWHHPVELESVAKLGYRQGGFNLPSWTQEDKPLALLLGKQFAVRGQAVALLRRSPRQNLCIAGGQPGESTDIALAAILSACLQLPPKKLVLYIVDLNHSNNENQYSLKYVAHELSKIGYKVHYSKKPTYGARLISSLHNKLAWRGLSEWLIGTPTTLVIINEPQNIKALGQVETAYDTEPSVLGNKFKQLLENGSTHGIHFIASFTNLVGLSALLSKNDARALFNHRVAFQMSEDDSYDYINSTEASKLQAGDDRRKTALLLNNQTNLKLKFSPYAVYNAEAEPNGTIPNTIQQIDNILINLQQRPIKPNDNTQHRHD